MAIQKNTKTIAVALVALVIVAAVAWFLTNNNVAKDTSGDEIAGITDGVHYQSIKSPLAPSATDTPAGKVSVVEFFWYGCPHCQSFEPAVRQWLETAPEDIAFRQFPVVWNEATALHAALFYVAEDAGNAEQLHDNLFEKIIALRPERNLSSQLDQLAVLYSDYGIDAEAVKDQVESAELLARVAESEKLMRQAEVSSTPTLLVDGKWVVLNNEEVSKAGGLFSVVEFLVQKARTAQ